VRKITFGVITLALVTAATNAFILKEKRWVPMGVQVSVSDIQEHGLGLISPSSTSFSGMFDAVRENMPGVSLEGIGPYSVFIRNEGRRAVVAFILKWELTKPDGSVVTETNQYVTKYSLMGDGISEPGGHIIRTNTAWLAFPGFAMALDAPELMSGDPKFAAYLDRVGNNLGQYTNVTLSLDGVFFEDGAFVGPDTTGFYNKVKALIDANQDLRREIEMGVSSGQSADDVFTSLTEETGKPKVRLGRSFTAGDFYNYFKRMAAEELLELRRVSGSSKALAHALRPSKGPRPRLRKE
jgi:hypothetical protein